MRPTLGPDPAMPKDYGMYNGDYEGYDEDDSLSHNNQNSCLNSCPQLNNRALTIVLKSFDTQAVTVKHYLEEWQGFQCEDAGQEPGTAGDVEEGAGQALPV